MNRILLALAILSAGTVGVVTARRSTNKLQHETSAMHESWIVQTQIVANARTEAARLAERVRELEQNLRQAIAAGNQKRLWAVLETNRAGALAEDLREHLLEELRFNWNASEDFIVVSKETVRDIRIRPIAGTWPNRPWDGRLSDSAAVVLALTLQERSQIEAAMERVKADGKDWVVSHTERGEPGGDVLAQYAFPGFPAVNIRALTNNFFTAVSGAVGKQRTELIMPYGEIWIWELGISAEPATMVVKRFEEDGQQLLKASLDEKNRKATQWVTISDRNFPAVFRPVFPNGWVEVAEREGFEIPAELPKK